MPNRTCTHPIGLYWRRQVVQARRDAQGAAATVSMGTVTTLAAGSQATVTNSGTAQAAVLNFGIPQGAAGDGIGFGEWDEQRDVCGDVSRGELQHDCTTR